ncbi:MAG: L-lactate dehydrogenase [Terriglobia bacterium]|jgi:L-lactate dehydrogenase|nr:L-lactate dehydrogenase [Terriglobia bacterium]
MPSSSNPVRVVIIGAGNVGATFAYALLFRGLAAEIVLIDANRARAEGESMDLNHAEPFTYPTRVWAGDYDDCAGAAIVVITAGAGQRPGETRLDLVKKNAEIFGKIVPEVSRRNPEGILLIATNPVDVLTQVSQKLSGLPPNRVIGSGTILDTARFRYLLGKHFGVEPRSVHAYIVGEHGDSEVPVWSLANIAGLRLADYADLNGITHDQAMLDDIFRRTRDAAYHIIERKGATYYAVAAGLMRIVEAILRDQHTVLSVSSLITDYYGIDGLCLSLPTVIGCNGIERVLRLQLSESEQMALQRSAEVLRKSANTVGV